MASKQAVKKSSWPPYPVSRGFYTRSELSYLAGCLGFPSALFEGGFYASPDPLLQADGSTLTAGGHVSEGSLIQLLDSKILDPVLEKVFDEHPAEYNVKVIKKAVSLLRRRVMTLAELSRARVGFELYSCEDGSGMTANLVAVMQAMKFLERVMSPTRMSTEIQKQQLYSLTPTRIQMYEFFDLVVMCERADAVEKRMKSCSSLESADSSSDSSIDISLPDFEQLLMTRDQKIEKFLDDNYTSSLYREVRPSPAVLDTDHIVSNAPRRKLLCLAKEESRAITPSLECSQSQLHRARNGLYVFSTRQHSSASATCHLRRGSLQHSQVTPVSSRYQDQAKSQQVSSLTPRPRSRTAPHTEMEHHSMNMLQHKSPRIRFQRAPQIKLPPPRKTSRPKPSVLNSRSLSSSSSSTRPNSTHRRTQSSDTAHPATRAATSLSSHNDESEHELSTVINSLCIESVVRARSAVKSSLASLGHHHEPQSSRGMSEEPYPAKKGHVKKTPSILLRTRSRQKVEPVVSAHDLTLQQGLIDNLEWISLRRKNNYTHGSLKAWTSATQTQ